MPDIRSDRVLALEGVENFRDYGDYATAAGRRLHSGRLYRSAHHARATDADLERMGALNHAVIVDLRRPAERVREPSRRPTGWAGRVIENDIGDEEGEAPHVAFLRQSDLSTDAVHSYMFAWYEAAPFEERHIDLFARYFDALAAGEGPVIIHCAAGKDRTGLLAALTHHLAGVSDADVVEDYLLTNNAARIERRAPEVAQRLAEALGRTPSDAAVRAFLGVEADYLQRAFDVIRARYGSLDAYLEQALAVDAAKREAVAAQLLG
jgi:protein tyrosine/serine phosphatase